jgi:beta-galactosidase
VPTDAAKDTWGNLTREFCDALDLVGYNYLDARYEWDGDHYPGRVIAGTESFPLYAYDVWSATERFPHVIGDFVWTAVDYLGESHLGRVTVGDPQPLFASEPWPTHMANCGDRDICGFKRPQAYFRDLLWGVRTAPYIGVLDPQLYGEELAYTPWGWEPVLDSWSFAGQEGRSTRVDVYAVDDEVELLINGVFVGRKPAGAAQKNMASFEVTYEPGTIEVIGYQDGREVDRTSLETAGAPAALRLRADRTEIQSSYGDLSYVTVEIVDAQGRAVTYAEPEVVFEVTGAGKLLAVGTAKPTSEALYVGTSRRAWQGRLMAVVGSTGEAGEIALKASAEGVGSAEIELLAV